MTTEFKQGDIVRHKSNKTTPSMVVNVKHDKKDDVIYCTYFNTITELFVRQKFDIFETELTKP